MTSVVVAAHNEGAVIGRCLDALVEPAAAIGQVPPLEVVVAANGCTDDTVAQARRREVVVVELPAPGKTAALNAAEQVAEQFPRVYLDADIPLRRTDVDKLAAAVTATGTGPAPLAATARRVVDASGRPFPVRAYYRVLERHPAYRHALFGRGVVVLSERGRSRFGDFPELLADDFFLDSLFTDDEKTVVDDVVSVVEAPSTTAVMLRRLARVRRGNAQLRGRSLAQDGARPVEGLGWLRDVVRGEPALIPAAVVYVLVTGYAVAASRWGRTSWGHDAGLRERVVVGG